MKAIILAAGQGSRMKYLTKDKPKCLIEFLGMTLIERQIENFLSCDISDIIIVTGYMSEKIDFSEFKKIRNANYASTNMVESLFCSRKYWDQEIIVSYGDIVYEKDVLQKLIESQHAISVVVDMKGLSYFKERFGFDFLSKTESLIFAEDGTVLNIGAPSPSTEEVHAQYIGLLKFTLDGIKILTNTYDTDKVYYKDNPWMRSKNFKNGYMTDMIQRIIDKGYEVNPVKIEGGWLEFDSIEDYLKYMEWHESDKLSDYYDINR